MRMKTPSYNAGYLAAVRDWRNDGVVRYGVSLRDKNFQHGYSDGWHKASGGMIL